jgi:hypothetical protein
MFAFYFIVRQYRNDVLLIKVFLSYLILSIAHNDNHTQ